MKDKGEIYLLVGEFDEYSARTLQFMLASHNKEHLETLRDELQKRADVIQDKYSQLLNESHSEDVRECALEDLNLEARAVAKKFNFRDHVEFTVKTVEFVTITREEAENGD